MSNWRGKFGNLGAYEDITKLAKMLGGVENLIQAIESDAAKKGCPVLLGVGVVVGAGATKGIDAGKNAWAR